MPNEPRWLPLEAVLEINEAHVADSGEYHALLSQAKLEGALMRPQNIYHYNDEYNVVTLSVTLMFAIAEAHAFEQGNKRTGFTSGLAFLSDNGFNYVGPDTVEFATHFKQVVEGQKPYDWFQAKFVEFVVPVED
ncbi:type II toxin-antitoxin system death-on-curing family toxin [Phyllobacterium sp. YR531]|uniref:type II toxin-antitoxin system death-on-curing family toxin n=1 Tax=Phyllobacterium sp. YR531 TaxID=1144343 RepID=UPI00026F5B53|nr:type II toxin-antitoxin system death-on-curing family toxin [Phyllobacterium sp. YR531]EJN04471.1 death-on-curing family protein [Phyllobacterium sp. YR531]